MHSETKRHIVEASATLVVVLCFCVVAFLVAYYVRASLG